MVDVDEAETCSTNHSCNRQQGGVESSDRDSSIKPEWFYTRKVKKVVWQGASDRRV